MIHRVTLTFLRHIGTGELLISDAFKCDEYLLVEFIRKNNKIEKIVISFA